MIKDVMSHSTGVVDGYLSGYLLVAMPTIVQSRFEQASIFVCGHDKKGAIGLILNKPLPAVSLPELLKQFDIPVTSNTPNTPLYFGGPVDMGRGFVLHTLDYTSSNTVTVNETFGVTATIDILRAIACGAGPEQFHICLGYSGWGSGQLEMEMQNNDWLISNSSMDLIFNTPADEKWKKCMHSIGLHEGNLPYAGGHA